MTDQQRPVSVYVEKCILEKGPPMLLHKAGSPSFSRLKMLYANSVFTTIKKKFMCKIAKMCQNILTVHQLKIRVINECMFLHS